ncbi:MAG TPA: acetate--CoA ligase [Nitrososphaeraceae archaeon]|nr:acetate--CoA ligase [Nitrososphaeraceae archaeon]
MSANKNNFIYTPNKEKRINSNISRFMIKHGITDYSCLLKKSNENIEWYWNTINDDLNLEWYRKYDRVYDSSNGIPWTRWFINGKCNIIANVIDKHAKNQPDNIAYIFENESGNTRKVSYRELGTEVKVVACALRNRGIKKGDVVAIYLPMIPEALFSILACSKIGAVHTTIFSGLSGQALQSRLRDSNAKMLITAYKMQRRSNEINLKNQWMHATKNTNISTVVVVGENDDREDDCNNNKIISYDEFVKESRSKGERCDTEIMDSEDPLFILYTSGTTGEPKGTIQVHGGFTVVAAQQTAYLIDMKPTDTLFWYADIGWITGQTWIIYGCPIVGGSALIYDGALDYPTPDTWCKLIDRHKVTIFGAPPTAIRIFIKNNISIKKYNFSSLRILAMTGEPINKEAWIWYFENVGRKRCPIINLSGGTEIGGAIVSALPIMSLKPCTVGYPIPGFDVDVFDDSGKHTNKGYLVIKKPWPSMTRGILNDQDRFIETYWSKYHDIWNHGDLVFVDSDGLWYIQGRTDDIIKVSGHRIGPAEVEAAITSHPAIAEAAVIGIPDKIKGEAIAIYATLKTKQPSVDSINKDILKNEIIKTVEGTIGKFASPKQIKFVADLPKTRTGKLVRRLIRAKVSNTIKDQDITMIENPASLDDF